MKHIIAFYFSLLSIISFSMELGGERDFWCVAYNAPDMLSSLEASHNHDDLSSKENEKLTFDSIDELGRALELLDTNQILMPKNTYNLITQKQKEIFEIIKEENQNVLLRRKIEEPFYLNAFLRVLTKIITIIKR